MLIKLESAAVISAAFLFAKNKEADMLSYEEFKEAFCLRFPEFMGPGYEDYEIRNFPVEKRGRPLDGFSFCPRGRGRQEGKKITVMPTFYFDDIYKSYRESGSIEEELFLISRAMKNAYHTGDEIKNELDTSGFRDHVIAELMNPVTLSSFADSVPHRPFLDLEIVYRWIINMDDTGVYSSLIDNKMIEGFGIDEEELYECALKNTLEIIPPDILPIETVIGNIMRKEGKAEDEIRQCLDIDKCGGSFYVLTNKHSFRASAGILFEKVLREMAAKAGADFYIVPTSVNECLLIPDMDFIRPENLLRMLLESNEYYFDNGDQMLSESIYRYSKETGTIVFMNLNMKNV